MNALRILLIFTFIIYFIFYEPYFILYFLGLSVSYLLLSEIFYHKYEITNSKNKLFISMWSEPYDPQIYARIKISLVHCMNKLGELSKKHGLEINLMTLFAKINANIIKHYKLANTSIVFGKVIFIFIVDCSKRNL